MNFRLLFFVLFPFVVFAQTPPTANFTGNPLSGCIGSPVNFNSKPLVFFANLYDNSYTKMEIYDSRGRIVDRQTFSMDYNLYIH